MPSYRPQSVLAALTIVVVAALPGTAYSQALPDLRGTWTLNIRASDFGMSQPASSSTLVFARADDVLVLTRTTSGMGSERTTRFDQPIDGEVHDPIEGGAADSKVDWDGDTLVLSVMAETNMGPLPITERIGVSEDGVTLTISRSIAVPGMGDMVQTLVFDRSVD